MQDEEYVQLIVVRRSRRIHWQMVHLMMVTSIQWIFSSSKTTFDRSSFPFRPTEGDLFSLLTFVDKQTKIISWSTNFLSTWSEARSIFSFVFTIQIESKRKLSSLIVDRYSFSLCSEINELRKGGFYRCGSSLVDRCCEKIFDNFINRIDLKHLGEKLCWKEILFAFFLSSFSLILWFHWSFFFVGDSSRKCLSMESNID